MIAFKIDPGGVCFYQTGVEFLGMSAWLLIAFNYQWS